jgi:SulP family sulfate permease
MSQAVDVQAGLPSGQADRADAERDRQHGGYAGAAMDPDIAVHRISGAFFFGAAATVGAALERIAAQPRAHIIDFAAVPVIDSTAAVTIEGFVRRVRRHGATVYLTGAGPAVRRELLSHGLREPAVRYRDTVESALAETRPAQA